MINCIGFLPKGINIEKLDKFTTDEKIVEKLKHLDLPIVENDEELEDSDNDEFLVESDLVVYSTPNTLDLSYLQFHVYDNEMDDFVIHHDIYVFSSINDTEYLNLNNKHYVALGTFENNIMVYDALIKNPMTPQILLEGHSAPVMAIAKNNTSLFSGSEDKSIIEWDLEALCVKKRTSLASIPEKICLTNDSIVYGSKNTICFLNDEREIKLEGNVENIFIEENDIYIGDSSGTLSIFDPRKFESPKYTNKISEHPLTGLDVLNGAVAVSSLNGDLLVYDKNNFQTKFSNRVKTDIYSVKLSEENVLFFGDATGNLHMRKLDEIVFSQI